MTNNRILSCMLFIALLCGASAPLTSKNPGPAVRKLAMPNLVVLFISAYGYVAIGDTIEVSVAVRNTGTASSVPCLINIYISETEFIDSTTILMTTIPVPALSADTTVYLSKMLLQPFNIPYYTNYMLAYIDAQNSVDESDESDNMNQMVFSFDKSNSFGKLQVTSNTNRSGNWKVVGFPKSFGFSTLVNDVPRGDRTITFGPVPGYVTPQDTVVPVKANQTSFLHVVYQKASTGFDEKDRMVSSSYPNPVSKKYTIELKATAQNTDIVMYDSEGRLIPVLADFKISSIDLDLSGLQTGIYFVRITSLEGTQTLKLIKD